MAKLKMPLYSLAAKGSFGKGALTFCSHITRNHARYVPSWPKKHLKHLLVNHKLFKEAQKYWNWLPNHAKWAWNNCIVSQYHANINSPWRAVIKGRNLFFHRAIRRIIKNKRPTMTPYSSDDARIFWETEPIEYYSE